MVVFLQDVASCTLVGLIQSSLGRRYLKSARKSNFSRSPFKRMMEISVIKMSRRSVPCMKFFISFSFGGN
jgi:hypothetical protein